MYRFGRSLKICGTLHQTSIMCHLHGLECLDLRWAVVGHVYPGVTQEAADVFWEQTQHAARDELLQLLLGQRDLVQLQERVGRVHLSGVRRPEAASKIVCKILI